MTSTRQAKDTDPSVASEAQNKKLDHSQGGATTRDDATDMGVPMLPGRGDEPQGPEDALGPGPKRGDYTGRVGPGGYEPHETVRVPDAKPGEAHTVAQAQRPRTDEIGDKPGKGGVTTEK